MTLQSVLDSLALLSRQHEADLLTTIELLASGASVTIHWTPTIGEALPRECTLFFSGEPDGFSFGWVVAPEMWLHCVDEGLGFGDADDAARRLVESYEAVVSYLTGKPYEWVKAKTEATS